MVIKPPRNLYVPRYRDMMKIFLGGSIEMGLAEDWQKTVCEHLDNDRVLLLNPRRDDWDSTWEQSIDNPPFREQVEWELSALLASRVRLFYFDPKTKSPITLMELGISIGQLGDTYVCCPKGFWRKGNIDVTCKMFNVPVVETLGELIAKGMQYI